MTSAIRASRFQRSWLNLALQWFWGQLFALRFRIRRQVGRPSSSSSDSAPATGAAYRKGTVEDSTGHCNACVVQTASKTQKLTISTILVRLLFWGKYNKTRHCLWKFNGISNTKNIVATQFLACPDDDLLDCARAYPNNEENALAAQLPAFFFSTSPWFPWTIISDH